MTSKESYTKCKFDLKNHILESYNSSLNLTSSLLSKPTFRDACKAQTAKSVENVILHTSKMSLQNDIINNSNLKRKLSYEDLIYVKRKLPSQNISAFDRRSYLNMPATYLLQKEHSHVDTCSVDESETENDGTEEDDFLQRKVSEISLPLTQEMPQYAFSPLVFDDVQQNEFHTAEDVLIDHINKKKAEEEFLKGTFLTLVSTSLMYSPNFRDLNNQFCQLIISKAEEIATQYPEFILKVALYTRQELNIRTTANFLLAYAAFNVNCRSYLKRYFKTSICLPSDWLEVAEICKKLSQQKSVSFPSSLRKVMVDSFLKFDHYQLAKYNRDPMKSKRRKQKRLEKRKKDTVSLEINVDDQEDVVSSEQVYTLKRLIRLLHITKPTEYVMCILGKKYPEDLENFRKSKLPGNWEEEKAGKRMKLPVPETWETQLSTYGNKAGVWEKLIDKRKLPYMAMLRNIRNLLITGISKQHHKQVMKTLCEEKAVVKSRQFPLRFFAAYEVIHQLETINAKKESSSGTPKYSIPKKNTPFWKMKYEARLHQRANNFDAALLKEYRTTIDKAVEIACRNNIDPIEGKTLVICDALSCSRSECQRLKGSIVDKMHQACILLGMMISYAAEECDLKVIKSSESWYTLDVRNDSILENVLRLSSDITESGTEAELLNEIEEFYNTKFSSLLDHYLCPAAVHSQFDRIVLLTSGSYFECSSGNNIMEDFMKKYRMLINKQLLYVKVDLTGKQKRITQPLNPYDVMLFGFSDQLLRFISERGSGRQLYYIENIDKKYELKPMPKPRPLSDEKLKKLQSSIVSNQLKKWETARVFISSTFKDMHGERDLIVRYIIPEIRARAKKFHVNIQEVDLRWGVTEAESSSNKSLEICLSEAGRCEFFVGILGERYGQVCDYIVPDDPDFQWVKEYPPGASLTELEMYCAALASPSAAANNSFFYLRDKSFASEIPEEWNADFFEASECAIERLNLLKEKIKCSGLEVFENYPCSWGGVINGVPVVDHLEEFGERVLQNLWCALSKHYRKETPLMDQMISTSYTVCSKTFQQLIGQTAFMELCITSILRNDGIFIMTGKSGCGKTTLMKELSKENKLRPNFPYFFGIDSRSCNVHNMLIDLTLSLYFHFELEGIPPTDYQDLVKMLPIILEMAIESSQTSSLVILIDGLDQVMYESEVLLDWIPCSLPKGVKLVFAVSQESPVYRKLSEKLMNYERYEFAIKPLPLPERQEIVTHHLEPYRKVLDNKPFNNQLLLLTSKREAGYPLYLYLACEELRTFGIFEKLTWKLRNYPQTISHLLKEILTQLENVHGKRLVKMAVCLLGISPEGLNENELHILISFITCTKNCDLTFEVMLEQIRNTKPESILPPMKFSSLLRTLRNLLHVSETDICDTLRIKHGEVLKFVKEYYMDLSSRKTILMLHRLLAAYFYNELMPEDLGAFSEEIPVYIFRLLPYHLILSEQYNILCNILCNINYIKSALKSGIGSEMLDHYLRVKELIENNMELKTGMDDDSHKKIDDYYNFLCSNLHILQRHPQLIHQQGSNECQNSSVYKDCNRFSEARVIRWMTKTQTQTFCYLTLSGFKQAIVSIAASPDGTRAALGAENGVVHIISISTGKLLKTFTGHSQMICNLCFIGNTQLCSASADCTLNLWDIDKGYRMHILTGHSRRVTACCGTPCGSYIISVSWDCSLRVWDVKNGQLLNTVKKTKHPLTCVSHHPYQELVVTGGWDTKLQIWDLVKITKKAVLKGHSTSVRAVAFSPCGETIVSSSFSGEIFYWSVAQCVQIGKITNMGYPATCLNFTKSGDVLITGSKENTLKLWSYKRGEIVQQVATNGNKIHCLTFLSLEYIAVGYKNGMCVVIEISTGCQYWKCHEIKDAITCIEPCFEKSSKNVCGCIIGSSNGSIMTNDLKGNKCMLSIVHEVTAAVVFKGNVIAGTNNGEIYFMSAPNFDPYCIPAHQSAITKCLANQDQLVTVSKDYSLKIWYFNEDCGLVLKISLPYCHGDWVTACLYSDSILVTGSQDCTLKLWDVESLKNKAILSELKSPINHIALEGNYIVAGTRDGGVGVWTKQGYYFITSVPPFKNHGFTQIAHVTRSVSSEDKETVYQHLLATADDKHLIIRKPFTKKLLATLPCHANPVSSFCVTLEDKLISCSFDDKVEFWKLKSPEQYDRHANIHHKAAVTSVGISPNEKFGFSTDSEGKLVVWTINLSDEESALCYKLKKEWESASIPAAIFIQSGGQLLIVCAVTKVKDNNCKENFAELLKLDQAENFKESGCCTFTDEVLSMDSNLNNIAFGLKSGMVVITNKFLKIQKTIKASLDWIIGTMFSIDNSPNVYAVVSSRILKLGDCTSKHSIKETWKEFDKDISWPTAFSMIDDKVCIGRNDGFLHIFSKEDSQVQKVHSGSVKDISVCYGFIFTCSEDNSIRVWDSSSVKQVGQFYFPLPITVLKTQLASSAIKSNKTIAIICGTKFGEVHLLTWTTV